MAISNKTDQRDYTRRHCGSHYNVPNRCGLRQPLFGYTVPLLPSVPEGTFVQIYCNESHHLVGNSHVRLVPSSVGGGEEQRNRV